MSRRAGAAFDRTLEFESRLPDGLWLLGVAVGLAEHRGTTDTAAVAGLVDLHRGWCLGARGSLPAWVVAELLHHRLWRT